MDKSRLQKNLRNKLAQSSKAKIESLANSEAKASTKVSSETLNSAKSAPRVQSKETVQNPVRSELQKKIEKDIASKKQEIFEKINPVINTNKNTEVLQPEHNIKADKPKKAPKVKPQKKKAVKEKTAAKPFRYYIPLLSWYSLAILIVLFDQMTKALASSELIDASPMVLTSWLQFDLVRNPGAAFSLFADAGGWQRPFLVFISLSVSIFLVVWLSRLSMTIKLLPLALTFVLGGAVGNLIDRALAGSVVDFISIHYQQLFFPSFNIADAAISLGAFLLFLDIFFGNKEEQVMETEPPSSETNNEAYTPTTAITAEELLRKADAKKAASAR